MRAKHQKEGEMMTDLIARIADLTGELKSICDENPTFSVKVDGNFTEVFISVPKVFFKHFDSFDIEDYKCIDPGSSFISKAIVEIEGIQFSTLLTQSEYEKFVRKTA